MGGVYQRPPSYIPVSSELIAADANVERSIHISLSTCPQWHLKVFLIRVPRLSHREQIVKCDGSDVFNDYILSVVLYIR